MKRRASSAGSSGRDSRRRARVRCEALRASATLATLSPREMQVLKLVVDGKTSKEIAAMLKVAPSSVDTYRSRLMSKLGVNDLVSLVRFAIRNGVTHA
jgi:DNA-binding NarL/FixJ family response regulator